jgi:hypothetical protein
MDPECHCRVLKSSLLVFVQNQNNPLQMPSVFFPHTNSRFLNGPFFEVTFYSLSLSHTHTHTHTQTHIHTYIHTHTHTHIYIYIYIYIYIDRHCGWLFWVPGTDPEVQVRFLEGLGKLKEKSVTSSEIECATFKVYRKPVPSYIMYLNFLKFVAKTWPIFKFTRRNPH